MSTLRSQWENSFVSPKSLRNTYDFREWNELLVETYSLHDDAAAQYSAGVFIECLRSFGLAGIDISVLRSMMRLDDAVNLDFFCHAFCSISFVVNNMETHSLDGRYRHHGESLHRAIVRDWDKKLAKAKVFPRKTVDINGVRTGFVNLIAERRRKAYRANASDVAVLGSFMISMENPADFDWDSIEQALTRYTLMEFKALTRAYNNDVAAIAQFASAGIDAELAVSL